MARAKGKWIIICFFGLASICINPTHASADPRTDQQIDILQKKVKALEEYIDQISPVFNDFSKNVQDSLKDYSQGLEFDLKDYSRHLQDNIEERLKGIRTRIVLAQPDTSSYQRIDTNTGVFLIAYSKIESIGDKTRIHLNVGNPNYADYRDFKVKLFWGQEWNPNENLSYALWQSNLQGVEFTFKGMLYKGMWNSITLDLPVQNMAEIQHVECELDVLSIELQLMQNET
ncbi:MAG: DUF3251 domain-containing protein [Candidatus Omnitrophica bacterium]|nr:DUF3251 domain-containing protein [Candidatus Omnitrophota bacterium]